jgi:hypothetical protein
MNKTFAHFIMPIVYEAHDTYSYHFSNYIQFEYMNKLSPIILEFANMWIHLSECGKSLTRTLFPF